MYKPWTDFVVLTTDSTLTDELFDVSCCVIHVGPVVGGDKLRASKHSV